MLVGDRRLLILLGMQLRAALAKKHAQLMAGIGELLNPKFRVHQTLHRRYCGRLISYETLETKIPGNCEFPGIS